MISFPFCAVSAWRLGVLSPLLLPIKLLSLLCFTPAVSSKRFPSASVLTPLVARSSGVIFSGSLLEVPSDGASCRSRSVRDEGVRTLLSAESGENPFVVTRGWFSPSARDAGCVTSHKDAAGSCGCGPSCPGAGLSRGAAAAGTVSGGAAGPSCAKLPGAGRVLSSGLVEPFASPAVAW